MTNPHLRVTDPYPFQSAEFNGLHNFYANLKQGRLTTTRCRGCDKAYWPPRRFCPQCVTGEFDWVDLPKEGTIHAFTVQEAGVPHGFSAPLVFAIVAVENFRIFSLITSADPKKITIGQKVKLTTLGVSDDPQGEKRTLLAFEPS